MQRRTRPRSTVPRPVGRSRRRWPAVALLVGLVGALGITAPTALAAEAPAATTSVAACPDGSQLRLKQGARPVDPNDMTRAESVRAEGTVATRIAAAGLAGVRALPAFTVDVDTYVHVITRDDGSGGVTRQQIDQQIAVLNAAFAGKTSGYSAATLFRFTVRAVDSTRNSDWYDWALPDEPGSDTDDAEAKAALHRGDKTDLNIYIAGLGDGLLGYSQYPWATSTTLDGLVLLNDSLPGGSAAPYNLGDTATHEIGHWLGLAHTFENGCAAPGDGVPDTPYQFDGDNIFFCAESDDTCTAPGRDPVHNFMSYGDDPCLDRFTAGQSLRMGLVWYAFRGDARELRARLSKL
ncbi:zinc metalloprotease [Microbacteriaceae bacterium VKM Ac-2855]|nr:zinc metalloprotease [Microbacteriaceae bacterium VKM Ac-2855]